MWKFQLCKWNYLQYMAFSWVLHKHRAFLSNVIHVHCRIGRLLYSNLPKPKTKHNEGVVWAHNKCRQLLYSAPLKAPVKTPRLTISKKFYFWICLAFGVLCLIGGQLKISCQLWVVICVHDNNNGHTPWMLITHFLWQDWYSRETITLCVRVCEWFSHYQKGYSQSLRIMPTSTILLCENP